jgi:MOSC domain-containing protein YiiM
MKVLSVNVGRPRDIEWRTETVQTAIYKAPVSGAVASVAEIVTLYTADADSRELLQRAVRTAALPQAWRDHFRTRIWEADS